MEYTGVGFSPGRVHPAGNRHCIPSTGPDIVYDQYPTAFERLSVCLNAPDHIRCPSPTSNLVTRRNKPQIVHIVPYVLDVLEPVAESSSLCHPLVGFRHGLRPHETENEKRLVVKHAQRLEAVFETVSVDVIVSRAPASQSVQSLAGIPARRESCRHRSWLRALSR